MTHRENFQRWFVNYLRSLAGERDAGFIVAMVTFSLLERYVRQLTNSKPKSPKFLAGLRHVLPDLLTQADARVFWSTYRNGLLHHVTLSRETHGLTHDSSRAVEVRSDGKVWLNPDRFCREVLSAIENDFAMFECGMPLSTVYVDNPPQPTPGVPNPYLGTGVPPGQGRKI